MVFFCGRTRTCDPKPHDYLAFLVHEEDERAYILVTKNFNQFSRNLAYKVSGTKYMLSTLMGYIVENFSMRWPFYGIYIYLERVIPCETNRNIHTIYKFISALAQLQRYADYKKNIKSI